MTLIKNKKEMGEVNLIDGKFISKISSVRTIDKIKFICVSCKKASKKEIREFKKPISVNNLICGACTRKETFLDKYGVENPQQVKEIRKKTEKTNLKKYNGRAPICDNKIKDKIKETNLKKYGVENVFQSNKIKDKIKETNLKKYGVENPMLSEEIVEKSKNSNRRSFYNNLSERTKNLVSPLFLESECIKIASSRASKVLWKCNLCGNQFYDNIYSGRIPVCKKCFPVYLNSSSKKEKEIKNFLSCLGFKMEKYYFEDSQIGRPSEIDLFTKEKNIGIEFNGLYWHSERKLHKNPKTHHLQKQKMAEEAGIRLIQIFEDEWNFKQEIVKNRLRNIFGKNKRKIGARQTLIEEISAKTKNEFLNKYHIQGEDKSKYKFGAFYGNELISVMTFSKPRIALGSKNDDINEYELSRFATISNTSTPGMANKLLKYFIKNHKPNKIYSYSDKRWNTGRLYEVLGFKHLYSTYPNYWYIVNGQRVHRFKYRKSELIKLLENFNPELTEYQNMLNNGYDRIWDCGNDKWELTL